MKKLTFEELEQSEDSIVIIIKMVAACINADGEPDFGFVKVKMLANNIMLGEHYEVAKRWFLDNDYEEPMVIWDEVECPYWLFERFVWKSASIVKKYVINNKKITRLDIESLKK
jgi:hypothetical protein